MRQHAITQPITQKVTTIEIIITVALTDVATAIFVAEITVGSTI